LPDVGTVDRVSAEPATLQPEALRVLEGVAMVGNINTDDDTILQHVEHSIRLGYPQIKPQPPQAARVCLVGGGPSLEATFDELRDLYFAGAKVVTVNGSNAWCLERNIRPSAHIVLDARAGNARFIGPPVPQCHYLIASQCHPNTWAAVKGRDHVWIWHAAARDNDVLRPVLDAFYLGNWAPTPGGTTVIMRALAVLSMIGYLRFDLFGVDSCYLEGRNHAYPQPENDADRPYPFRVHPTGHPELGRTFQCAPWHAKQLECFLQMIRINGNRFLLNVHGDGLLAFALKACAQVEVQQLPRPDAAETEG
jgi:hypothetical protein